MEERTGKGASRQLDMDVEEFGRQPRKRKSKMGLALHTPDLNVLVGSNAIVPVGLVNSMVYQLDMETESSSGGSLEESLKK